MKSLVNFIIESGISVSLFSVIYVLFLRRETFFRTNRMFLLLSVLFSILLPFLRFKILNPQPVLLSEITVTPYRNLLESITVYGHGISGDIENVVVTTQSILYFYFAGVLLFISLFLFRLLQIIIKVIRNRVVEQEGFKLVILNKDIAPFSFLNYVFIGEYSLQNAGYNRMLIHELEHVKQGHSFDVIILELLTAFQWFNPFMWLLRRAIRENHEYLADRAVLNAGASRGEYKQLLLNQFIGEQLVVANNFNYSLIKNRIKMMSKIKSSKIALTKTAIGILMAAALLIAFACEQKESVETKSVQNEGVTVVSTIQDDGKIKIEGTADNLMKYKAMFANSSDFEIITDSLGNTFLVKKVVQQKSLNSGEEVFFVVEEMPEFPGGEQSLREFIAKNIQYPAEVAKKGIQGKVYVTFVVGTDGNVKDTKIARGVDPSLDAEALRVVSKMNGWKPGKQKGQLVNVSYTIPINFKLQ